jgi:AraC-like DNA-binding protein
MDISVPIRELPAVVALAEALIFAGFLASREFRGQLANRLLIVVFLLLATVKLDQLYQMLGGFQALPSLAFVFTPVQWLLTPALYFFIVTKVSAGFSLKRIHLLNLLPAVLYLLYMWVTYYSLPVEAKIAFLESGALGEPINAFYIPFISDLVQIGYLWAALMVLNKYGVTLRNWFSGVDSRNIDWAKSIIFILMLAFVGHMIFTVSRGLFESRIVARFIIDGLNIIHLVLINALMFFALLARFEIAPVPDQPGEKEKYAKSALTDNQRAKLFEKAQNEMISKSHFLDPDLDMGELASRLTVSSRELSEAINGAGHQTFYEFVNHYRVEAAKTALADDPGQQVLNVAFASGFNSKSTFNQLFKKATGTTPSGFRKSLSAK